MKLKRGLGLNTESSFSFLSNLRTRMKGEYIMSNMPIRRIVVGFVLTAMVVGIAKQIGCIMGVKDAVDSLDESAGIKEVTVKIPGTKNSTYTYSKGE